MLTKTLIAVVLAASAAAGACSRTTAILTPAPNATPAGGPGRGAVATAAGVRVTAHAGAWQWGPTDLATKVTPILLEMQNNGNVPVLLRYNRIALTDAAGHHFAAMPPYDTDGSLSEAYTVQNPYYGFNGFAVAPYLSRWYPRFSRYNGAFAYDQAYYRPYVTRYEQIRLPTVDMVQRALPEGVLSPAGSASGFVYFEPLDRDAKMVTLTVDIVNAETSAVLGTASIPFVAQ